MTKLKSCPFCGGEAVMIGEDDGMYQVICPNCNGTIDDFYNEKEVAAEKWNTRPIEDDLREENRKLREALEKYAKGKNYIGVSSDGTLFEFEETAYGLEEMPIGWAAQKALKGE